MSLTNKVLYDIDQTTDTTPAQRETARKNIGAYEDKTTAGGGTGIPKGDLASDVQSSLGKADSSVQSVTSNGQSLTKSAAGAIDIPKATDTKWGVVQVVNELKDNQNVIPNSRVIKEAVDGLSAALQARATFWTVQEWQTQSAQPGDASKIYYVGPKGTGNDQYDMYEWRTSTRSYVLTDESTISLDGYWHGAPDIVGEDTVAPFITSIEKNADDTVKYRTCSATVGDLSLPVFMDSGVVTPADPHYMYPTVTESTSYEEVKRLVDAGYRPIFVPSINSYGIHTRYILTGAVAKGYDPSFVFTALVPGREHTLYFTREKIGTVICQHANDETELTWVWNDQVLIPNIPEPNDSDRDVGKVLTVGQDGELYWDEGSDPLPPAGENQYLTSDANSAYLWRDIPDAEVVRAGSNNLHVSSASEPGKTIYSVSADYYQSRGSSTAYSGPGTVIINSATMNIESTNSGFGYKETLVETSIMSASYNQTRWSQNNRSGSNVVNMTTRRFSFLRLYLLGQLREDCVAEFWSNTSWYVKLNAEELRKEPMIAIPDDVDEVYVSRGSENLPGEGYAVTGYNLYGYQHSDNVGFSKGELAWKDEIYRYVDEQAAQKEPLLPAKGGSSDVGKVLTVSGRHGELCWTSPASYREGQYIHIDANNVITASGLQPKLPTPNSECYLCGTENGGMWWLKRKKYMYKTTLGISGDGVHTITQTDINNKYCDIPIIWSTETDSYGLLNRADNFLFALTIGDMRLNRGSTNYPLNNIVSKIKCSLCDETETWFSNDNAHGNDPHGMIFDDILGSELARVPGYPTLDKEVRRVAYGPNNLAHFMGPSFRVMFSDTSTLAVGDKIEMDGIVSGIDFKDGGWGAI